MIKWVRMMVVVSRTDDVVPAAELAPLKVAEGDSRVTVGKSAGNTTKIALAEVRRGSRRDPDGRVEDSEQFERDLIAGFADATAWLARRPAAAFDELREKGIRLQLFLSFEMNQDQMQFEFPPDFLRCLGERGLKLHVISNDF